ncbi:Uncharacterized protein SCF082_LOCUS43905 [Durusdinium trenchii]|uniref:Uncharacterized protein n=1 Tax=Durusdinium trenchii TaxID=1381693 RepID=A0ABP0QZ38_9DINO
MAKESFPDTCIFPDILDCVANPPKKKNWAPGDLELLPQCHCVQHMDECPLNLDQHDLGIIGAPCILFSKYGLREGFNTKNIKVKHAHDTAMAFQKLTPISIHENVPDYEEADVAKSSQNMILFTPRLCPRQFGHPNRRLRVWRILYNKELKKWDCPYTLGELANLLLAPLESKLLLDFNTYLCASPSDLEDHPVYEQDLSASQQKHLRIFRQVRPDKDIYDLSANALKRCRTETVDKCMPCLTTSSQLWPQPSLSSVLWGEEPEEAGHDVRQPLSESSSGSEADYRGSAQTVFSMGWNSLLDLKKATFWKEGVNSAPEKKKRKYNNTERAAMASYSRQSSAGHFKENGVDPGRLQKLFKLPSCQCANVECFKQFKNSKDLPSFLRTFWNMQKSDQDSMVQLCLATTSESRDKQFTLLDRPVGFKCLAALLGVGTGRLRKGTTSTPDLRHGTRNVMELFEEYKATQQMLGGKPVSCRCSAPIMAVTPFKTKAEERAKLVKKEEEKDATERPAKRMCNQYEKQLDLLEYVGSFRGEQATPGEHPAALIAEIFASDSAEHNHLHCTQLEGWYFDYAKMRNMSYLFKKPESVVVDPSMKDETIKVPITCLKGAERQAPSALQLALRFSRVLEIYEQEGKRHAEMSTEQRLQDAVSEFNQSPGLQAKHRIEEDRFRAVLNLLSGTSEESREVIRNHLDAHKWAQSAFSTEQFKGSRWMLTASPKASACPPELRKCLTVTPHSQALHLRLVIKMFLDQGRRLRASARARARLSSAQFDLICDFACVFSHVWEEARLLASWNEDKEQAMAKAFFQRDYAAEIEAAVTAKLSSWKPQRLSLWVDLVEPPAGPSGVASAVEIVEMEDQAQAARYREVSAKLSQDIASMTAFNTASSESSRRNHVVNVMHQKAQVQVGKQLCEAFMEKHCRVSLVTKKDGFDTGLDSFIRAAAASRKVAPNDVDCILYFDCTKLCVLSQAEINLIGDYAEKILFRNTQRLVLRSVLVLIPPLLVGSESGGSLRGDFRFCGSSLWLRQSLQPDAFPKALEERNFIVPGEAFLSHDSRRSLTDLQETAQWMGGVPVCQSIFDALTGGRKNFHAAVLVHPTLYDGCVELAGVRSGFIVVSSSGQPPSHNCGKEIIKTHLLEAWKAGRAPMDKATPRYKSSPAQEDLPAAPSAPDLKLCQVVGGKMVIPQDVRKAFLTCPVWGPDWRETLKKFDQDWGVAIPDPVGGKEASATSSEALATDAKDFWDGYFPGEPTTYEALKGKYGDDLTEVAGVDASTSFVLAPGPCLFINAKEAVLLKKSDTALISHGAGTWLLADKADKLLREQPGKAIPCCWSTDQEDQVDSAVMTLRKALQHYEAKGYVEYTLGGHLCTRPPSVQQGREADCFEIKADAANTLAWKPNAVPTKNLKAANLASAFSWSLLENSPLDVVWRLRFWANEKCIAPAKPLYHLPHNLELPKGGCKRLV